MKRIIFVAVTLFSLGLVEKRRPVERTCSRSLIERLLFIVDVMQRFGVIKALKWHFIAFSLLILTQFSCKLFSWKYDVKIGNLKASRKRFVCYKNK